MRFMFLFSVLIFNIFSCVLSQNSQDNISLKKGTISLKIIWPAKKISRLIPVNTEIIVLSFIHTDFETECKDLLANTGESNYSLDLYPGQYEVHSIALANYHADDPYRMYVNGFSPLQNFDINSNQTTNLEITIQPVSISVSTSDLSNYMNGDEINLYYTVTDGKDIFSYYYISWKMDNGTTNRLSTGNGIVIEQENDYVLSFLINPEPGLLLAKVTLSYCGLVNIDYLEDQGYTLAKTSFEEVEVADLIDNTPDGTVSIVIK